MPARRNTPLQAVRKAGTFFGPSTRKILIVLLSIQKLKISCKLCETWGFGRTYIWGGEGFSLFETFSFERSSENNHRRSDDRNRTISEKACQNYREKLLLISNYFSAGIYPRLSGFFNKLIQLKYLCSPSSFRKYYSNNGDVIFETTILSK